MGNQLSEGIWRGAWRGGHRFAATNDHDVDNRIHDDCKRGISVNVSTDRSKAITFEVPERDIVVGVTAAAKTTREPGGL